MKWKMITLDVQREMLEGSRELRKKHHQDNETMKKKTDN